MAKDKKIVTAFGRMNPPTIGHQKLIDAVLHKAKAEDADHDIRVSHSQDKKKNPLTQEQKLHHLRKMFPKVNFSGSSKEHPSFIHHLKDLHSKGYTHVTMIAGSDRAKDYEELVNKYNKDPKEGGEYHFKSIKVVSAGHRDPDAEGAEGMSASKMRQHAQEGNYHSFKAGLPSHVSHEHAQQLYNDVRNGMDIKESIFYRFKTWLNESTSVRSERKALHTAIGGESWSSTTGRGGGAGTGFHTTKSPDEVHKHLQDMGYKHTKTSVSGEKHYAKDNHRVTVHPNHKIDLRKPGATGVQHYVIG